MTGALLGTLPVNLSNPDSFQISHKMLGTADRRGTDYSQGKDVLFFDVDTPTFVRLTNDNGEKAVAEWGK